MTAALLLMAMRASAFDFTGSYAVLSAMGNMTLVLEQDSAMQVQGTLRSTVGTCRVVGEALEDEDGQWNVEGQLSCPAGGGSEFTLSYDEEDEDYLLLLIPFDEKGVPRSENAAFFEVHPSELGSDPPLPDPANTSHDGRLVGTWSTQVVMNSPAGSIASEMAMEIRNDGMLVDLGSRSLGGDANSYLDTGLAGGGEPMLWRANGSRLEVSVDGVTWVTLATYEVDGQKLFLRYYDGDQKLWYRR